MMSEREAPEPARYEICTVADFFKVPEDRRDHCMTDFGMWLSMVSEARQHFAGVPGIVFPDDVFQWIDDGKHDAHVRATVVRKATP